MTTLEKYKYGLFVIIAFYILSVTIRIQYGFVKRPDLSKLLQQDKVEYIELKIEPKELVEKRMLATGKVQNAARNENGEELNSNPESYYGENRSLDQVEQSVYDLEQQFYKESGGDQTRSNIRERVKELEALRQTNQNKSNKTTTPINNTSGNATSGKVLVSYDVEDRNGTYVPAPGYMCPQGTNGKIVINVKVNQSGQVVEAVVNSSTSNDSCMMDYALRFAKKSKFSYHKNNTGLQKGTITYVFVN